MSNIPTLFSILVLLLSVSSCVVSFPEDFIPCLISHANASHPISSAIFVPTINSSYSSVLQAYIRNLRFNTSTTPKPFLIVTALHESHVQASVICAQKHNLQMKIRSGGHDYEGVSYVSFTGVPFFVLDMFNLRSIHVDINSETAWVQTGATLGEVYYRIAEKSNTHGFPAGVCPTVGVGGHFGGAGYGNMMRKGGGGASFGVVLSYKINLVRVPETVTVFRVERTLSQNATDIVYHYLQVADRLDEDLFIRLTLDVVETNQTKDNNKTVRAAFIAIRLYRNELGEICAFLDQFSHWNTEDVLLSRTPQVLTHLKRKSDYLKKPIPKKGLEWIWKRMIELETPMLTFNPYGGKMAEISSTSSPFPHRAGNLAKIQYATNWDASGAEAAEHYIDLTRKLHEYMTPFVSKNPREAFLTTKIWTWESIIMVRQAMRKERFMGLSISKLISIGWWRLRPKLILVTSLGMNKVFLRFPNRETN
ncbi:hypothetical protein FNV43_RR06299 [Rhamnella rubrinervis]|uniref:FAD-binding PCMH-type domain-containing protein n=1 Tax=Rhamnella rubrinervis TaxID=2594499 RepID=A0A8K0HDK1_9ROSA|nr:hypothetical protein FNV43_RR06299 [Rhamnella rubrinervis]